MIGIHISFGDDGQWYPDRPWSFKTFDYSEGSRKGIIGELKKMYHHDLQALRQAWGEPTLEFDQIKMPSPMELSPNQVFLWPDLPAEKRLIDCILAYHRAVITTMDLITAEFKKSIGKPTVALTYFPINCVLTQGELLRSEQMDGIVAVPGYMRKRRTGSHNESGHALGSFRLHKKIYLDEVDFRSDYGMVQNREYRRYVGASEGLDDHFHQLRRNFAFLFSQGEWGWFRTLGVKGHFNWYGMYAPILGEIQLAAKTLIEAPVSDDWGQVAVFRDDLSQAYYSFFERHDHRLHHSAISIRGLSHSGLSWNSYLLSDLENPVRPHAKINLFSTATSLSEKQIQWIENNLQKNGNILVFIGDAGRIAPGGFEKNIHRLTGMRIKAHPEILVAYKLSPDRFDDPLSTGMPGNALWFRNINGPLFLIEDPDAQPLALLSGTSFPAMSVKRHPNWTAVYLAGNSEYALTAEFLRKLATEAGIQPIGPEGDVTYCGNGFLAIHAVKPGRKEIFLKSASELTDLSTGEKVAEKTSSYSCYMNAGETRWFRIKY